MTKATPWSYSSLTSFETCARRHYLTRVTRIVSDPPGEAAMWGNTVHKAIEYRLKNGKPLPASLQGYEGLVQMLTTKQGKRLCEYRLAVDKNFRPVEWYHPMAWSRSIVDYALVGENAAILVDWKTGKRKVDSAQLRLSSALAFAHFPYVQKSHTVFIWMKENKLTEEVLMQEQKGDVWNEFLPRVERLEAAFRDNRWPAKPSGLCGKWCPITTKHCEHGRVPTRPDPVQPDDGQRVPVTSSE